MTYIARGLFSAFVADMEMQCTPQALFLAFKSHLIRLRLHSSAQLEFGCDRIIFNAMYESSDNKFSGIIFS
jgi:hypothetical protein